MDARLDPPSMQASPKATPTSSATPAAEPATTPSARSSISYKLLGTRDSSHPPHRLRHGIFHQRCHAQSAASSLETAALTPQGLRTSAKAPAPGPVNTSSGSLLAQPETAVSTTSPHPPITLSSPNPFRSTASSTMCAPENSSSRRRQSRRRRG